MNFTSWLRNELSVRGGIPFEEWMRLVLYHPQWGYYAERGRPVTGREGDFYTSVSVGPIFGAALACQFRQMWELLGRPGDFTLAEQGAMDARLALDILDALRQDAPELHAIVRYRMVEFLPSLREKQEAAFAQTGFDRVEWSDAPSDLAQQPFTGVFYSNELVDSFPIHLISFRRNAWHQAYVISTEEKFQFEYLPIPRGPLADEIVRLNLPPLEGYTTEINLAAADWMKAVAASLAQGFVLTIDYGYPGAVYYQPERNEGTLQTYRDHRGGADPLDAPGEQDITAHVNFSALAEAGTEAGLHLEGFTDQHHFLTGLTPFFFQENQPAAPATLRQWKTLLHPEMMGTRFQYLVQSKGITLSEPLHGLRFARAAGLY